ncbi:MAG: hypothetical protein M5U07_08880 [Xanthobacteraceae bacterium]|nr:hypothetical protein [Xanthobacteraceae bacterium]
MSGSPQKASPSPRARPGGGGGGGFRNQGFELTLRWPGSEATQQALEEAFAAFHALHARLYTFAQPDTPIEIVTLHVTAIGTLKRPSGLDGRNGGQRSADAAVGEQKLFTGGRFVTCPILDRARLDVGATISGPAIIRQHDTTTVIEEGQTAIVHPSGSLIVRLN